MKNTIFVVLGLSLFSSILSAAPCMLCDENDAVDVSECSLLPNMKHKITFNAVVRCTHIHDSFCLPCIREWVLTHEESTCPLCKPEACTPQEIYSSDEE